MIYVARFWACFHIMMIKIRWCRWCRCMMLQVCLSDIQEPVGLATKTEFQVWEQVAFYLHSECSVQEKFGSEMVHFVRWYFHKCGINVLLQPSGVTWPRWRTWSPSTTRQKSISRTRFFCSKIRLRTTNWCIFSTCLLFPFQSNLQKACPSFCCKTGGHWMYCSHPKEDIWGKSMPNWATINWAYFFIIRYVH